MNDMPFKINVTPYSALAPIYDAVMQHVNYRKWANYIHALIQKFHQQARWIVDLSCGTGSCCAHLYKLGYQVTGVDASLAMIRQARTKFSHTFLCDTFFCADMVCPPLRRQPDAMISLYDSMNYLQLEHQWLSCLNRIHADLSPCGLFIFDVSTIYNSRTQFSHYFEKRRVKGGAYQRSSFFEPDENIQTNQFEITLDRGASEIYVERHRQKIRTLSQIDEFIGQSPFKRIAAFRDFTFETATEQCERVHFILQKPGKS
jgi:predicted TPR repeat methyltransferase